jgi:HPt (histidine-containing phosphotransfer) domain-containing protein
MEDQMATLPLIDREEGLKRVMNNAVLYNKLLGKFKAETQIEPIFTALAAVNWEEAQHLTHTIKGVSANLSLMDLNAKIVELETCIKAQSVPKEPIDAVKASFAETMQEIDKVLGNA